MKIDRPHTPPTPEEQLAATVRELRGVLTSKTKGEVIEALARAMRDGKELARSEYDLGNILILAVLGFGTKLGEPDAADAQYRLVLDTQLVKQVESGAWVMTREVTVSGDVVLIAQRKAVRGTMDVPEEQSIAHAPKEEQKKGILSFLRGGKKS